MNSYYNIYYDLPSKGWAYAPYAPTQIHQWIRNVSCSQRLKEAVFESCLFFFQCVVLYCLNVKVYGKLGLKRIENNKLCFVTTLKCFVSLLSF